MTHIARFIPKCAPYVMVHNLLTIFFLRINQESSKGIWIYKKGSIWWPWRRVWRLSLHGPGLPYRPIYFWLNIWKCIISSNWHWSRSSNEDIYVKKPALESFQNLPVYLYFHGGAFLAGSWFSQPRNSTIFMSHDNWLKILLTMMRIKWWNRWCIDCIRTRDYYRCCEL